MAQVVADHHDPAVAADHFALLADRLDARLNLHVSLLNMGLLGVGLESGLPSSLGIASSPSLVSPDRTRLPAHQTGWAVQWCDYQTRLLVPVHDSATSEVVGRKLNDHPILRQDADVVLPHLSADVGEDLMSVLQLNAEHRIGQRLDNTPLDLDGPVFLRHILRDPGVRLPASPVESMSIR